MFGRSTRKPSEPARQSLRSRPSGDRQVPRTVSYYTAANATAGRERRRSAPNIRRPVSNQSVPFKDVARRLLQPAQLPLLIFVVVLIASLIKISLLSYNPKVVFITPAGSNTQYVQDTGVYAAAVRQELARSPLNHFKLTADVNGIQTSLAKQFPELEAVTIDLPLLGNRPITYVTIATPAVDLSVNGQRFRLNGGGVVLERASGDATLPVIQDNSGRIPAVGSQALPGTTVAFAGQLVYQLKQAGELTVSSIDLPANAPYEMDVRLTGKPYYLRFNLQADVMQQSGAAIAVIQKLGTTQPKAYIDLRVPGRAYYK